MTLNLLILTCLACWSAWGIFDKKALESARHLDVLLFQHILYVGQIPLLLAISFIIPSSYMLHLDSLDFAPPAIFWTGASALVSTLAMLFYLLALSRAQASFVLGITACYPLLAQFLAHFFLQEEIVAERLMGSGLVGLGVALIGWSQHAGDSGLNVIEADPELAPHRKKTLVLLSACALAALFWALAGLFDKSATLYCAPFKVYLLRCLWNIVCLSLLLVLYKKIAHRVVWRNPPAWKFSLLSTACLSIGGLSYIFALTYTSISYLVIITGCYPLFMYLFALVFLKEPLQKIRLAGVALVVGGGILVQNVGG